MDLAEANKLALSLLAEHDKLREWKFRFSQSKRIFGQCCYREKTIELSIYLAFTNSEAQVRDTLLHEIAHAMKPGCGHNAEWKMQAVALGAKPERCFTQDDVNVPYRYIYECPSCERRIKLYRRSSAMLRKACGKCCKEKNNGFFSPAFRFVEKRIFV